MFGERFRFSSLPIRPRDLGLSGSRPGERDRSASATRDNAVSLESISRALVFPQITRKMPHASVNYLRRRRRLLLINKSLV